MGNAGTQIDSQTLYDRQQEKNRKSIREAAPIVIATGLRTPDNIASVLRLTEAAYSNKVIFVNDKNQMIEFDNKIKRLSRDTHKDISIEQYELEEFLRICHQLPEMMAIEITTQSKNIFNTSLPNKCCFVVGSESHGVNSKVLKQCKSAVHIPMYGSNGSMNVTHALAISLFEWRRQTS